MNTKFQFSLTSKSTSEIIRYVSLNLDEVKLHIRQFTSKRACCPVIAGVLMNLLYFHLFQASKIKIILQFVKGDILKKNIFNVDQIRPFNVIESVDKMKMWEQL